MDGGINGVVNQFRSAVGDLSPEVKAAFFGFVTAVLFVLTDAIRKFVPVAATAWGDRMKARADAARAEAVTLEQLNKRLDADFEQIRLLNEKADLAERKAGDAMELAESTQEQQRLDKLAAQTKEGEYQQQIGVLTSDVSGLSKEVGELRAALAEEKERRAAAEKERDDYKSENDTLKLENSQLRSIKDELTAKQEGMQAEINTLKAEVAELKAAKDAPMSPVAYIEGTVTVTPGDPPEGRPKENKEDAPP